MKIWFVLTKLLPLLLFAVHFDEIMHGVTDTIYVRGFYTPTHTLHAYRLYKK